MVRSTWLAMGVALLALARIGDVRAQVVHKCIINGNAVYQAAACPSSNESKSLVIPAPPSQQELLDATANGRLQNYQPGAGVTAPAQRRYDSNRVAPASTPTLTPSLQEASMPAADTCEQLNQAWHDAQYRRDELSAPGTGATRAAGLQRALDDMKRVQDQASQAHCALR
jgi:hypothetical protein